MYIKKFNSFEINESKDVYVTNANGDKKRIYVHKKNGFYAIGCNGTSLHKTNIDKSSLEDEIEKMKELIKKEKF